MIFVLTFCGMFSAMSAALGWTPEWMGRPTAVIVGAIFLSASVLTMEVRDALRERRPETTDLFAASDALKRRVP